MRFIAWPCVFVLAAVTGCNQTLIVHTPTARVTGVKLVEKTSEAMRVAVTVELTNPNDIPLPLIHSGYTVSLDGAPSFTRTDPLARTLPASGKQTVELPAVFPGNHAGAAYRVSGSVTYEPPGDIRKLMTESGIPRPSTSFASTGKLE